MSERGGVKGVDAALIGERPTGLYTLVIMKFTRNRVALFGLACLLLILLAILLAPQVTPYDPIQKDTPARNQAPSLLHPFGTDKLGRLAIDAISNRDYPMIQGTVILVAASFVFVNLIVDIIYAFVDPRIRYE